MSSDSAQVEIPRIYLAGSRHGVGVSTVMLGLLGALKKRRVGVNGVVVGNRLTQATHYRRVTSALSHSLDLWAIPKEALADNLARASSGAELLVVEGEHPIFDSFTEIGRLSATCVDDGSFNNEGSVAAELKAPVVLVLDAEGYAESFSAQVYGFSKMNPGVSIAGVIANRLRVPADLPRIKAAVENLKQTKFLGALPYHAALESMENVALLKRSQVFEAAELVERNLDIEGFRRLAAIAPPIEIRKSVIASRSRTAKIAVADDMAFHLTSQGNLDILRREGGELVAFSPLVDRKLPGGISAIYLPGGFPHLYASELSANTLMLQAFRDFVARGGLLYAEGTSVGYLCKSVTLERDTPLSMVGIIPGTAALLVNNIGAGTPSRVQVESVEASIVTREGERFRGYRDYIWAVRLEEQVKLCFSLTGCLDSEDDEASIPVMEGFSPVSNVVITSVQPHWASNPMLARNFLDSAS